MHYRIPIGVCLASVAAAFCPQLPSQPQAPTKPPTGPFGYTLVKTADGLPAEVDAFILNDTCGVCHERQFKELQGSMHSAAHLEPLYRQFAELARKEAGDEVYTLCSGCHSAPGVVSKLIPAKHDPELPPEAKVGVSCDVCHQISSITGAKGPWREEGNASFVLEPGRVKFGSSGEVIENRSHTGAKREFFGKSEFCASCHTVIHPTNGLRIEETYEEWKSSVYAEKGIQCQDCHMQTVENAVKVAEQLKPVILMGQVIEDGPQRRIHPHFFGGGNANADRLAGGAVHAEMAEARLKSAARLEVRAANRVAAGAELSLELLVHNVAAGHNIPTGVTELREMWVDIEVKDGAGKSIFRSGQLDDHGEIPQGAIRFGAVGADKAGNKTYKPWEMAKFLFKRTVPPKGSTRDQLTVRIPAGTSGPLTVSARLLYRSVAPHVVKEVMRDAAFEPKIVEMAKWNSTVAVQ